MMKKEVKASKKRTTRAQSKSVTRKKGKNLLLQNTYTQKNRPVSSPFRSRTEKPQGVDKVVHFIVTSLFTFLRYLIVFFLGAIAAVAIVFFFLSSAYLKSVSASSSLPVSRLLHIVFESKNASFPSTEGRLNMLILGTDALANRDEESKLTDTIMLVSVSPQTGVLTTFSIPRDLWIASQSAKINGLYGKGESVVANVVGDITGLTIHKVLVIDIATVGKIIDAFGGLDITVERSFVDYRFPRSDVDVRVEHNVDKLYETVAFTKGVEHMSGDRALKYIRSRHSSDPVEGTDDARVLRQQQVISAVIVKIQDPLLLRNPEQIGKILKIYQTEVSSSLSLEDGAAVAWKFVENKKFPVLSPHQFTIREVDKNGQLTHPNKFPGGAWVYLPVDPTYTQFRKTVNEWLSE